MIVYLLMNGFIGLKLWFIVNTSVYVKNLGADVFPGVLLCFLKAFLFEFSTQLFVFDQAFKF